MHDFHFDDPMAELKRQIDETMRPFREATEPVQKLSEDFQKMLPDTPDLGISTVAPDSLLNMRNNLVLDIFEDAPTREKYTNSPSLPIAPDENVPEGKQTEVTLVNVIAAITRLEESIDQNAEKISNSVSSVEKELQTENKERVKADEDNKTYTEKQDKKVNRLSFAALVVAIIAAAIAIGTWLFPRSAPSAPVSSQAAVAQIGYRNSDG